MKVDVEIIAWRSDLLRTVVEANDEQDAANKVGEALGKIKIPRNTVTSLDLDDGQTVQVTYDRELADDIDVKSEAALNLNADSERVWDRLVKEVEAMFKEARSTKTMLASATLTALCAEPEAPVEATGAAEWLEAALRALADHVADPAVEDATRLQGLYSSFCDQLRADEPDPEELCAVLRGIVEVLPRLEDRTCEILNRMDRLLKMVARLD